MTKLERFKWFMIGAIFVVLSLSLLGNYLLITNKTVGYTSAQQALMDDLMANVNDR